MGNKDYITFTKMHGAGNDYIYIWCPTGVPRDVESLAVEISDRHTGVGSDGLVLIMPSNVADFRMRIFNADGSEALMCGNASRCIAKYVYDHNLTDKRLIKLETLSGIKTLSLDVVGEEVEFVTVDMGEPIIDADKVPVATSLRQLVNEPIKTSQGAMAITAVSMGNPHGVIFVDDLSKIDVHGLGRELENHAMWPNKANIEFAQVDSQDSFTMRVWERGSGETLACGTGACATVVAAVLNGLTYREVDVHLPGGTLHIEWGDDGHVYMRGPAATVCEGRYLRKS